MMAERIEQIRARLAGVDPSRQWKYNPEYPMFIGTTNALEMYHGHLDLGRNAKEWTPYQDETGSGYRLTESSKKQMARVKALGEFLESCREDIAFLLDRVQEMEAAIQRIVTNCRDADCGDHCSNSCMFCQARQAIGSSPDSATTHEDWCLIDKPECGPVHCTCGALRCKNCSHGRDWHLAQQICQVFACACEKFEGAE